MLPKSIVTRYLLVSVLAKNFVCAYNSVSSLAFIPGPRVDMCVQVGRDYCDRSGISITILPNTVSIST